MRKIARYFATFVFCEILYGIAGFPIYAQWIKYPANPVIKTASNTWYSAHAGSPTVLYDENKYKMWFQGEGGQWAIGYAESTNGIDWTVAPQPQITISSLGLPNVLEVVEPSVIKNGSIYQMWFKETIGSPENKNKIRYAESSDGLSWSIYPQVVLETPENNTWESLGPTNPSIIFDGQLYHLWYVSAGTGSWKIGYASSSDGKHWTKSANNPLDIPMLDFVGGVTVKKINGMYHMWYHVGQGGKNIALYHATATSADQKQWVCTESCEVFGRGPTRFDSEDVVAPDVLIFPDRYLMWYTGNNGSNWLTGLATYNIPVTPTPAPTTAPSPSQPLIIIPGFMASWNKDAILHNQTVTQSDWKAMSFTHEYDGIVNTLDNIGYRVDRDYFVFYYDWRKGAESLADDLQNFIQKSPIKNQTFSIMGHSYGGLIARIYAQKYPSSLLHTLITVGSPHQGTALAYKPVEAGEPDTSDPLLWLAEKTLLQLYRDGIKTDRQIINEKLPAARDLFPSYDFLRTANEQTISIHDMHMQNTTLQKYGESFFDIFPHLRTVIGEKHDTLLGYSVTPGSLVDQILDLYPDGRPIEDRYQIGDYTIISSSSKAGNDPIVFPYDHGEIIYKKEAIKSILHAADIDPPDDKIASGSATIVKPSLIFYMLSPARLEVLHNGILYPERDGIVFIPGVTSDTYTLKVTGIDNGPYKIVVGEITNESDTWKTIDGAITASPPDSQTDIYTLSADPQNNTIDLALPQSFDELINYLAGLNTDLKSRHIEYTIRILQQAKQLSAIRQLSSLKSFLLLAHSYLLVAHNIQNRRQNQVWITRAIEKLEQVYEQNLTGTMEETRPDALKNQYDVYHSLFTFINGKLLEEKKSGADIVGAYVPISNTGDRLSRSGEALTAGKYAGPEIWLKTSQNLISHILDQ